MKPRVTISNELHALIREEAAELDMTMDSFVELTVRAALKRIGISESIRIGMELTAYKPPRAIRKSLPWEVVRTVTWLGRTVTDEYRLGDYRLAHVGRRGRAQDGHPRDEIREPHGRKDQALDGWYLTGPDLMSPYIWLGTNIQEVRREAGEWGAHLPERRRKH